MDLKGRQFPDTERFHTRGDHISVGPCRRIKRKEEKKGILVDHHRGEKCGADL